jgi:hypothetical protein
MIALHPERRAKNMEPMKVLSVCIPTPKGTASCITEGMPLCWKIMLE